MMRLYRYQPINKFTIENLVREKNWASKTKHFNDPFEFNLRSRVSLDENGRIVYLSDEEERQRNFIKQTIQNFGIVSYSSNEHNTLLWAHYSENHKGICLAFDINNSDVTNIHKIKYSNKIPNIKFGNDVDFTSVLTTKGSSWSYEEEYRQIFNVGDCLYPFPGILKEVIFGCRTPINDIELILKLCFKSYNDLTFSKMFTQEDTFLLSKSSITGIKNDKVPKIWSGECIDWKNST